jgi:hypothetical protein
LNPPSKAIVRPDLPNVCLSPKEARTLADLKACEGAHELCTLPRWI